MSAAEQTPIIDEVLVKALVADQFPQWAHLPVAAVVEQGWDNRTYRLGDGMGVRLPSHSAYAAQIQKERSWLPFLQGQLTLAIPKPMALGIPGRGYPWNWSINQWIEGRRALSHGLQYSGAFARASAKFLNELQMIPTGGGPAAGEHSFHRGGHFGNYDSQTRDALEKLGNRFNAPVLLNAWSEALGSRWQREPVWVHGDFSAGNLIVDDGGALVGVIDFGQACVGDPACDLAIAWSYFRGSARRAFLEATALDRETVVRARAWAMWKAAVVDSGLCDASDAERQAAPNTLLEIEFELSNGTK
jgi:aminoglycoside phosphotransferase (APT) family kinase protein